MDLLKKGAAKGESHLIRSLCKDQDWVSARIDSVKNMRRLAEENKVWTIRADIKGICRYQDLEGQYSQDRVLDTRVDLEITHGKSGHEIKSLKTFLSPESETVQGQASENLMLCRDFLYQIKELQDKIKMGLGRYGDEKVLMEHGIPTHSLTGVHPPDGKLCKKWMLVKQDQGFGYTLKAQPVGPLKDCTLTQHETGQTTQKGACTFVSNLDEAMYAQARLLICKAALTSLRRGFVRLLDENKPLDAKSAARVENLGINPKILERSCASIKVEGKGNKAVLVARPPGLLRDSCQVRLPLFAELQEMGDCVLKPPSSEADNG